MSARNLVPIHSLGISQIIAFGLQFYIFAQIKAPLALWVGVTEAEVLYAISALLLIQFFLAPFIGGLIDKFGALYVLARGLVIGAVGMALLPLYPSVYWMWAAMVPIGIGFAMSSYETAFSAAVKIDEKRSRRNISFITFYGGVASSLTWLSVAPLLEHVGLQVTCFVVALILLLMSWRMFYLSRLGLEQKKITQSSKPEPFTWSRMSVKERWAILILGSSSSLEMMVFVGTSLLWISWFNVLFNDLGLAVILASLYGPFQVVGRVLEMKFGHQFDARLTGLIAFLLVPISLMIVQVPSIEAAILAMAIFGMGHGVLTVTFGYVTNLYFKAEVYGRAKGWIVVPRALASALGPTVSGILFLAGHKLFFSVMIAFGLASWLLFLGLMLLKPREDMMDQ